MENNPIVSICCITYNQEKYIRDAIDSFLVQETKYSFEILIGEDCSQDMTRDIAKEYQAFHPDTIRVFENETNIRGRKNLLNLIKNARGKYIALCEGDDYWTDQGKIESQVKVLEEHPECSMCFHAANVVSGSKRRLPLKLRPYKENRWCSTGDIIPLAGGGIATNSKVFRKSCFDIVPDWYKQAHVGDMPQDLLLAHCGDVYYIDRVMSVYRLGVKNSWTRKKYTGSDVLEKKLETLTKDIKLYQAFDEYTKGKYSQYIDKVCNHIRKIMILLEPGEFREKMNILSRMKVEYGLKRAIFIAAKYMGLFVYARMLAFFSK